MTRIAVIDNYDSFVYNLVQYLQQLGAECRVWRNDVVTVDEIAGHEPDGVLISPGPGVPAEAGVSEQVIRWAATSATPLLGVCLGHQAIAEVFGGTVDRSPELMHGKTSEVTHDGTGLFAGMPDPFTATRYHSLAVVDGTVSGEIEVTARTVGGTMMALKHRSAPIRGMQFHPESVLTEGGHRMLANWLVECGDGAAPGRVAALEAEVERVRASAFTV